jgi:hypothetical protein
MTPLTQENMIDAFLEAASPYAMLIIAWGPKVTEAIVTLNASVMKGKTDMTLMLKNQTRKELLASLKEQVASGGIPLGIYSPRLDEGDLIEAFPWEADAQTEAAAAMMDYLTDLMYEQQQRGTEYSPGSLKKYKND